MSNLTKNADGCCEWVSCDESPVFTIQPICKTECCDTVENLCGMVHPMGSGTVAGCNSTTQPHIGVVMHNTMGNCTNFAYYTSGNTVDYANNCGGMDVLSHVVAPANCCPPVVTYTVTECGGCGGGSDTDNTVQNIIQDTDGKKYMVLEDGTKIPMPVYHDLNGNPVE